LIQKIDKNVKKKNALARKPVSLGLCPDSFRASYAFFQVLALQKMRFYNEIVQKLQFLNDSAI